ncbi:hypothetical protein C2E25_03765 [Geothermobacter hydrogeniphilus]|uniref:Uncharacterized protein n=1 Tax=Geothermobacter hydrogeniphilus TaxID=1969733 RepID=A0A2K2HCZ1_9BACT|nr:radical SAM protein [Geothermobacter hydrogeniphilus]PNU21162.1 hypothetical protein C2E25_03765 [Geothermobacter hydrogeniphilus]
MRNGRVLFIIHDNYQDFNYFPLGVAYLAAVLRDAGADVQIYCQDLYHQSNEELAAYLDDNTFDLIGIGFLAARFKETVEELCRVVTRHKKEAWLVLGGHGPSALPAYMLQRTGADVVAIGDAEQTVVELLHGKISGTPAIGDIRGIAWRRGSEVHHNRPRPAIRDLDSLPLPAWELFPMRDYIGSVHFAGQPEDVDRSLALISSRGCVNACSFCHRLESGYRVRSVDNVLDELQLLIERYRIEYFLFLDEMFILNKKRLLEFERKLDQRGMQIRFSCAARVDIIDREVAGILKRCGCRFITFGIESTNDNVLRLMRKNTTLQKNIRAVEAVNEVGGIGLSLNLLWGNIGDTEESLRTNVEFIKRYNNYQQVRTIRPPTPYPGSALYQYAIEQGLLTGPDDFFDRFSNSDRYLVNFTDLPLDRFYRLLLEANRDLILDHYRHTGGDMEEARRLIRQFEDLYSGRNDHFRGARDYTPRQRLQRI